MDIDAAHKAKTLSEGCQCCRKVGHWAKECNLRFNVHFMDTDELEEQLERKHATPDKGPVVNTEDFVFCSG